jgi:hypothetical protein
MLLQLKIRGDIDMSSLIIGAQGLVSQSVQALGYNVSSCVSNTMSYGHGHEEKIRVVASTAFFGLAGITAYHGVKELRNVAKMPTRLDKVFQLAKGGIFLAAAVAEAGVGYLLPSFSIDETGHFA